MNDQFYTKDELEVLNSSVPSEEPFQQTTFVPSEDNISGIPQQTGMLHVQQANTNSQGLMNGMSDPNSKTYKNVRMGLSFVGCVKNIIFGLIFGLFPLSMLWPILGAMRTDGAEVGAFILMPVLMILLFVGVGLRITVKGIIDLISIIKNK